MAPGISILACLLLILAVGCGKKDGDSSLASVSREPQIDVKAIQAELAKARASDMKVAMSEEILTAEKPVEKKKTVEKKTVEKKKPEAKKVAEKKPEEKKPDRTWRDFLTIPFVSKRVEDRKPEEKKTVEKKAINKKPEAKKVVETKLAAQPEPKKIVADESGLETADIPLVEPSPEELWTTASHIAARPGSHEFGPRISAAGAPAPAPRKPAAVSKKSSMEPKPAPAASTVGDRYIVQAGAFRSKENAEKLAGKLSSAGFGVNVQSVDQNSASLYLVRVTEMVGTMTEARQVVDKLKSAAKGIQAQIITAMPEPKP